MTIRIVVSDVQTNMYSGYGLYFVRNKYYRYSTIEAGHISRNINKLENIEPNPTNNNIFII